MQTLFPHHDPCYPSLFVKPAPTGTAQSPRTWLAQLARMSATAYHYGHPEYRTFIATAVGHGWTVLERICVQHKPGLRFFRKLSVDCAVTFRRTEDAVCAIAFVGTDDGMDEISSSLRDGGVRKFRGYGVLGALLDEYQRFGRRGSAAAVGGSSEGGGINIIGSVGADHGGGEASVGKKFRDWMAMARDGRQCRQVYITGHSLGGAIGVLHRLDLGVGRVVAFGAPLLFAPYAAPGPGPTQTPADSASSPADSTPSPSGSCFGDAFYVRTDPIKAFPPGFRLGGLRTHSLCENEEDADGDAGATGLDLFSLLSPSGVDDSATMTRALPAVVEPHGCGGSLSRDLSPCDALRPHYMQLYVGLIEGLGVRHSNGDERTTRTDSTIIAGNPAPAIVDVYGRCSRRGSAEWIDNCVRRVCQRSFGRSALSCDLGAEELRGRLRLAAAVGRISETVSAGSLGGLTILGAGGEQSFGSFAGVFQSVDRKRVMDLVLNPGRCGDHFTRSGAMEGSSSCFTMDSDSGISSVVRTLDTIDRDTLQVEIALWGRSKLGVGASRVIGPRINPAIDAAVDQARQLGPGLRFHVSTTSKNGAEDDIGGKAAQVLLNNVRVQPFFAIPQAEISNSSSSVLFSELELLRTQLAETPPTTYILDLANDKASGRRLACANVSPSQKACLVASSATSLDLALSDPTSDGQITYQIRNFIRIDEHGRLTAPAADDVSSVVTRRYGPVFQHYPNASEAEPVFPPAMTYCAQIIPGVTCGVGAGRERSCDSYRNAVCLYGGVCGCPKNHCANAQGMCVSKNSPAAKRRIPGKNPCLGGTETSGFDAQNTTGAARRMYIFGRDPSHGNPFERCLALGAASHVRIDYPSAEEMVSSGKEKDLRVNLQTHVGFSLVPLAYERLLQLRVQVVNGVVGKNETGKSGQSLKLSLNELAGRFDNGASFRERFSRSILLPTAQDVISKMMSVAPQEFCHDLEVGGGTSAGVKRSLPVAQLCLKTYTISVAEQSTSSTSSFGPGATSTTSRGPALSTQRVEASVCVPALTNTCFTIPLANLVVRQSSPASRARELQESRDSDAAAAPIPDPAGVDVEYELQPVPPTVGSDAPRQQRKQTIKTEVPWVLLLLSVFLGLLLLSVPVAGLYHRLLVMSGGGEHDGVGHQNDEHDVTLGEEMNNGALSPVGQAQAVDEKGQAAAAKAIAAKAKKRRAAAPKRIESTASFLGTNIWDHEDDDESPGRKPTSSAVGLARRWEKQEQKRLSRSRSATPSPSAAGSGSRNRSEEVVQQDNKIGGAPTATGSGAGRSSSGATTADGDEDVGKKLPWTDRLLGKMIDWVPLGEKARRLLTLDALAVHFGRIYLATVPVLQLPLLPDEVEKLSSRRRTAEASGKYLRKIGSTVSNVSTASEVEDRGGSSFRRGSAENEVVDSRRSSKSRLMEDLNLSRQDTETPEQQFQGESSKTTTRAKLPRAVKAFLALRRSHLIVFVVLASLIISISLIQSSDRIVHDLLLGSDEAVVTHDWDGNGLVYPHRTGFRPVSDQCHAGCIVHVNTV